MSLIPDEELKKSGSFNLAPMVDFLFLIVAIFATMAITRTVLFDTNISLVKLKPEKARPESVREAYLVNISVTDKGEYKWLTEVNEFLISTPQGLKLELLRQQKLGLLPKELAGIKVLLHIDKEAKWEPIAQAIFAVREGGFQVSPVYEPAD